MATKKAILTMLWQSGVLVFSHLVLGYLGYSFYQGHTFVALGWPAFGVEVVLVAWWGLRLWPSLILASGILHFLILDISGLPAVFFVVGEVGEILFGAFLLARGIDWARGYRTIRQMRRGLAVALLAPLIGAAFGALGVFVATDMRLDGPVMFGVFGQWWLRSAIGFLVMAPAVAAWRTRPLSPLGSNPWEGGFLTLLVLATSFAAFTPWNPIPTLPLWFGMLAGFPLIWAGARSGIWLTSHLSILVLAAASFASLNKVGIFSRLPDGDLRAMWWMLLNVCALSGSVLAILMGRAAEQARGIAVARRRLELLIHDSPLALVEWDLDFRVRRWSREAEAIFGFRQEQVVSASGLELLVPVEERGKVLDQWQKVLTGQAGVRTTNHNLTAEGKRILCDWYGSPVHDEHGQIVGVVCLVEDVSERERAAQALRESEQRFQSVAEVLPQLISYYSMDLFCLFGNRAFCAAHNWTDDDFPVSLEASVDSADMERIGPYLEQARNGDIVRFLETIELADGTMHDLDRILLPEVGEDGKVRGFFSVITDITAYRAAARDRLALEIQVLQTQKLESLGLLSGKIAHEFNNRLCGILGHTDMARHDLSHAPERAAVALGKAIDIARETSDLCRQLFVYSGYGSGEKVLEEVNPLIQEMRRLLELTLPRQVRLKPQLEESLPRILVDASQMRQAIVNLVQNAAQAIGNHPGDVCLRSRMVRLGDCEFLESFLRDEDPETELVEIAVEDSGEGVLPEDLRRIFEPFYTRRPGARGLGLSGVLGIIHGHSGAIAVDSVVGQGTTVRMYLLAVQGSSVLQQVGEAMDVPDA